MFPSVTNWLPFQLRQGKKKIQSSVRCYAIPITTGEKKDTVVWPSFVAPFQLSLLHRSNYGRKKKIQSSVHCYAIPITTRKKRYSCLTIICCAVPIAIVSCAVPITTVKKRYSRLSIVTPFQLQPEKKIQSSGHHLLRRSNCHCCAVPITTGKKRYSCLSVVTPFQIRPEKKQKSGGCAIVIMTKKKSSSCLSGGCMIIIATRKKKVHYDWNKKRYSRLSVVTPFQIRPEKKKNLAGARSLLRPEKKSSSRLSGGCMINIMTGKKKF